MRGNCVVFVPVRPAEELGAFSSILGGRLDELEALTRGWVAELGLALALLGGGFIESDIPASCSSWPVTHSFGLNTILQRGYLEASRLLTCLLG